MLHRAAAERGRGLREWQLRPLAATAILELPLQHVGMVHGAEDAPALGGGAEVAVDAGEAPVAAVLGGDLEEVAEAEEDEDEVERGGAAEGVGRAPPPPRERVHALRPLHRRALQTLAVSELGLKEGG